MGVGVVVGCSAGGGVVGGAVSLETGGADGVVGDTSRRIGITMSCLPPLVNRSGEMGSMRLRVWRPKPRAFCT